jgi:hypothetical protein
MDLSFPGAGLYDRKLGSRVRQSDADGSEVAPAAYRDSDHKALPQARVVGGRGPDRGVSIGRECAPGRRLHAGHVGTRVRPVSLQEVFLCNR